MSAAQRRTPNPPGWEEYDGSRYQPQRGYGWLTDLSQNGRDRGAQASVTLEDGTKTSPEGLGRLEVANWQGTEPENQPLVFRIDLPNDWYRVSCTSVEPGSRGLPLVDQRSFKCRAHDVVMLGANYGAPFVVGGDRLVEGCGIVEVTDNHLRIVVGDPAYGGWTWQYQGPWYRGWQRWWGFEHQYAKSWYQKLRRIVDPGFHSLRLNALQIERVDPPVEQPAVVFHEFFNRDDNADLNAGVAEAAHWIRVAMQPNFSHDIRTELAGTAIKLTGPRRSAAAIGLLQATPSPASGVIRYATRVSLYTGEGSQLHSGAQEAGLMLLAHSGGPPEFASTFVGVGLDSQNPHTLGRVIYRVGDSQAGYRTNLSIPGTALPFKITEGEYEIVVEHDVEANVLRRMQVNGVDLTQRWSREERHQTFRRGQFGVRSRMDSSASQVMLRQFYWYYRVETL